MKQLAEATISRDEYWRSLVYEYEILTRKLREFADTYCLSEERQHELKIVNSILAPAMAMKRNEVDEYHDLYVYRYVASRM
ncbi:MAG: hypothetical protein HYV04_13580 [Deltaproteobacteria bacterium]|nr:hypothetical protein [Deltaproteobacteria bacterium]